MRKPTHGFTLVELSIVLVVIGIVIGGILVATDLINAAKIRKMIGERERVNAAAATFRIRTLYLPGDIPLDAVTSHNVSNPTVNGQAGRRGNGNGFIDAVDPDNLEYAGFFVNLMHAGLINVDCVGDMDDIDDAAIFNDDSRRACFPNADDTDAVLLHVFGGPTSDPSAATNTFPRNYISYVGVQDNSPAMSPLTAYQIDDKIDDGLPLSGAAQAMGTFAFNPHFEAIATPTAGAGSATASVCINNSVTPAVYNLLNDDYLCNLQIRAQF